MSLVMLCFPCCVDEQPPPRRRPKIDRSQIGLPTNFQHTGHIGSGEIASGFDVHQVQNSMQSKGGYEHASGNTVQYTPDGIDVSKNEESAKTSSSPNEITITINSDEPTNNTS